MTNPVKNVKNQLEGIVSAAASCAFPDAEIPKFTIEIPADIKNGDFACNIALAGAKTFKAAPRSTAEKIKEKLNLENSSFERCEIAGPGFMNFFLSHKWFEDVVASVNAEKQDYGRTDYGKGEKVCVEYVSANPTGPMHIGNARGGAIGDCLASVMDYAGYDVTREFYINDAGNQIEKFAVSLEARYLQIFLGEDAIEFPEDAYHGDDIKQHAAAFAEIHGDKYVGASSEERKKALTEYALPINIANLKTDLAKYRIEYDVWFHESQLHEQGKLKQVIDILTKNGMTYEKDGALWYKATAYGAEKDDVLVRANKTPTYFAADIAYHYNKFAVRGFDKAINVWGADHHGHVARLKGAMNALGLDGEKLDIVLMQLVRLMRGGETVRVSKRTGKSITLNDLLEEVPVDAARFFFNMRESSSHLDFDLGLAVEQSSQNPVYYVQYAHARICSILKSVQENSEPADLSLLTAPEETELMRHIAVFPSEITEAARTYDPARMTRYSIELATRFHKFYNACRVICDDKTLMSARLELIKAAKITLKNCLDMLKISAPENM